MQIKHFILLAFGVKKQRLLTYLILLNPILFYYFWLLIILNVVRYRKNLNQLDYIFGEEIQRSEGVTFQNG
jgi:hypothetical protein